MSLLDDLGVAPASTLAELEARVRALEDRPAPAFDFVAANPSVTSTTPLAIEGPAIAGQFLSATGASAAAWTNPLTAKLVKEIETHLFGVLLASRVGSALQNVAQIFAEEVKTKRLVGVTQMFVSEFMLLFGLAMKPHKVTLTKNEELWSPLGPGVQTASALLIAQAAEFAIGGIEPTHEAILQDGWLLWLTNESAFPLKVENEVAGAGASGFKTTSGATMTIPPGETMLTQWSSQRAGGEKWRNIGGTPGVK